MNLLNAASAAVITGPPGVIFGTAAMLSMPSRSAQSISFAVAIDIASWVIPQLLQHGRVKRGYLGVAGMTVTVDRRIALAFGLAQTHAVRVSAIERDSPGALAGLHEGDMIVGLDGVTIDSVDRLHQTLDASRVHRDCHAR